MIRSMTAFAKSSYEGKEFTLDVFVRTYNHRFLDINLKLPIELMHLEAELRNLISKYLSRGRVEMTVKASFLKEGVYQVQLNKPLVDKLIREVQSIQQQYGIRSDVELGSLLRISGLVDVQTDVQKIDPATLTEIKQIIDTALKSLVQMRAQEGNALAKDILQRLDSLLATVEQVETASKTYPQEIKARLEKNLRELLSGSGFDAARMMQEVAYYAERSDFTEELVRLRSHILQSRKVIEGGEAAGRKMEFLLQEILREINAIGSKCDLLQVSQFVIEMKTEVEKIREQSQNVE